MTQEETTINETERKRERQSVMVSMPEAMKDALRAKAESADVSLAAFCRQTLADAAGYTGPLTKETRRTRKYSSEEERKAAQKARNKARREVIKELLEKYGGDVKAKMAEAEEEALEGLDEDDEDEDDE